MSDEVRPGFYLDAEGNWQVDRRSGTDRRATAPSTDHNHERRGLFRRQADRDLYRTDHKLMIEEALEDFAETHDGHL